MPGFRRSAAEATSLHLNSSGRPHGPLSWRLPWPGRQRPLETPEACSPHGDACRQGTTGRSGLHRYVVFFLSQNLSGVVMLSIPLSAHLQNQGYSALANHWVDQRVRNQAVVQDRCQATYDLRQQTLGKASMIALVSPFEALGAVALWRRRLPCRTHLIFALHFYSFALLLTSLLPPLVGIAANAWVASGHRVDVMPLNNSVSLTHVLALGTYIALATRRVYSLTPTLRVLLAVVLVTATLLAMYAHRFAVFAATLWMN